MSNVKRSAYALAESSVDNGDGTYVLTSVSVTDAAGLTSVSDVSSGWVVYAVSKSSSTGAILVGVYDRLKVTSVELVRIGFNYVLNLELAWDEETPYSSRETEPDVSGIIVLAETSDAWKLGYVPTVDPGTVFGLTTPAGLTLSNRNQDTAKILDKFGQGSGSDAFNGNRSVTRGSLPNVNVGGTTVTEWLNNYFFPFISATVSLNNLGTYEQGTKQNISFVGTLTLNSETVISARRLLEVTGGTSVTIATFDSNTGLTCTLSDVISSRSFRMSVDVGGNGTPTTVTSSIQQVGFIYPVFCGMSVSSSLSGSALYSGLSKRITTSLNVDAALTGNAAYIYYAQPSTYAPLTSIIDSNGFNVFSSYTSYQASVTSVGLYSNWTANYTVYRSNLVTSSNGLTFTFRH